MLLVKREAFLIAAEKSRKALKEIKSNMISGCIRVESNNGIIQITAKSTAFQIQTTVRAETNDRMVFIINAAKLLDCLALINGEMITFYMKGLQLYVECGNYKFQYSTLKKEEWWAPPSPERVVLQKSMPELRNMVRDCFHSLSINEDNLYSSFFVEASDTEVRVTAFDTKRLSIRGNMDFIPKKQIILPGYALKTVCQMVNNPTVAFTEQSVFVTDDNFLARITGRGSKYPVLHTLFPDTSLRLSVNRTEFLQNCNVMQNLGQEMNIQLKGYGLEDNRLSLSVVSPTETGNNCISIKQVGENKLNASLRYNVDLHRLIDALNSIHEKEIVITFGGNFQPICISGEGYIEVILCYINNKCYH